MEVEKHDDGVLVPNRYLGLYHVQFIFIILVNV